MITGPSSAVPKYLSALFRGGTPAALSDAELLERFAERSGAHAETAELAFAALLARHGPMVLRVCRAVLGDRHEVEDAFQATFLVLAVRARSIRRRDSVASWLHGVALRVSAQARSRAARRRRHERIKSEMTAVATAEAGRDPVQDNDLTRVIEQELGRLPEKYRAVVVLCYLEGMTHEMAADQLGWPVGSVRSRLAWARDRLRARLTRRGVAPKAVPFVRNGSPTDPECAPSPCIVPAALADSTLRGALSAGLGKVGLLGIVSAEAIALLEVTVKTMTNARLMLTVSAVVIAGLLTSGLGVLAYSASQHNNPAPTTAQTKQAPRLPAAATPAKKGPVVIQALVVDSEGRSVSGAEVSVTVQAARPAEGKEKVGGEVVSDQDGKICLEVASEHVEGKITGAIIWAYKPGKALARASTGSLSVTASPPVVRLILEDPVNRTITVVDRTKKPVVGLRLVPRSLRRGNRPVPLQIPDEFLERLTVTSDSRGEATLSYLPQVLPPLTVQVSGSEIAAHTLPLIDLGQKLVLQVGRPGRLVGIVARNESGQPLSGVPTAVWVRAPASLALGVLDPRPTEMIKFNSPPLTGPQRFPDTPRPA